MHGHYVAMQYPLVKAKIAWRHLSLLIQHAGREGREYFPAFCRLADLPAPTRTGPATSL